MIQKNDSIQFTIEAIGHEGNGIGRYEGMAIFVPMTAVGDHIQAKIVKVQNNYAFAIIEKLLIPSPDRIENTCPVYRQCGGCSFRHLEYPAELAIKAGWVKDNLERIGKCSVQPEPILASPCADHYRNKAQYPIRMVDGKVCAGFFARRSHRLIPVENCLLQPDFFRKIIRTVTDLLEQYSISPYDEETHTGLVRHLFIRHAETTGEVMVWLVINGSALPQWKMLVNRLREVCPGLASFGIDRNKRRTNIILEGNLRLLWGKPTITDTLRGVQLALSPMSFYQVNRAAAEQLFARALEYADPQPTDCLLDLYCGTGAVGLGMAHTVRELIGVEIVPEAIADARHNAEQNQIGNARFFCDDAAGAVRTLKEKGVQPDIIVLDPPRKGADTAVLDSIVAFAPRKLVYISCNSATLARDVAYLAQSGYTVQRACPADLFPRTANVETVCLLSNLTRGSQDK